MILFLQYVREYENTLASSARRMNHALGTHISLYGINYQCMHVVYYTTNITRAEYK